MRHLVTLVCGTALLAAAVPSLAQAPDTPAVPRASWQVTGHRLPLSAYVKQGMTPRRAAAQAQLDELVQRGLDPTLATRATAEIDSTSSSSAPTASTFLLPGGALAGGSRKAVLEQRFIPAKNRTQVVQLLARDGLTGKLLWTRKDTLDDQSYQVAFPSAVGTKGAAGLLLFRESISSDGNANTLIALNGAGKQLWTRTIKDTQTKTSSGVTFSFSLLLPDRHLHAGPADVAVAQETVSEDFSSNETSTSGTVRFGAINQATGGLRQLPNGIASKDGEAYGTFVSDQSGDGYDDVVTMDTGSAKTLTASRATGGQIWQRTDLAGNGQAFVAEAGALTGGRLQDLYLSTAPEAGIDTDPFGLGVPSDPTAPQHGTITLLTQGSGTTVWSNTGDFAYPLDRAGSTPALGVGTDESSTTETDATAKLQLDVYDTQGAATWSRTFSMSKSHASSDDEFAYAYAFPLVDLDQDGGLEGIAALTIFDGSTGTSSGQTHLLHSSDGTDISNVTSDFLDGSVTGKGEDRYHLSPTKKGLALRLTHGIKDTPVFTSIVPGSTNIKTGYATGYSLGASRCEDILVTGVQKRSVVGVLSGTGAARWTVSRVATDQSAGTVVAPKAAPKARC